MSRGSNPANHLFLRLSLYRNTPTPTPTLSMWSVDALLLPWQSCDGDHKAYTVKNAYSLTFEKHPPTSRGMLRTPYQNRESCNPFVEVWKQGADDLPCYLGSSESRRMDRSLTIQLRDKNLKVGIQIQGFKDHDLQVILFISLTKTCV